MTHSDVKRYTCPACGKQLKNDSCYRRHMVCVHGQKYSCELCSKDYSSLMGLNIHKRDVHGIITWIKIFTILSLWINLGIFSRKLFRRIKLSPLKIMWYRCGKYAPHQWSTESRNIQPKQNIFTMRLSVSAAEILS